MGTIANLFGYLLNFIYEMVKNYGLAIIIFSVVLKIVMLPISIKQQKSMKKSAEMQGKIKALQDKYKNNPEQLNKETMQLYKDEKMSPFSGCLSAIAQIVILLSMFYLVRSPLTHMRKVEPQIIEDYTNQIQAELPEGEKKSAYPEINIIEKKGPEDERVNVNMNFLGLNLSLVPSGALNNPTAYIIPALYVISSFISMRITTNMQNKKKETEKTENKEVDAVMQANKSMMYLMPVMSVSISLIAPLGLALYWLINNILMIVERVVLDKFVLKEKEETKEVIIDAK